MKVKNKIESYRMYHAGFFGNRLRAWDSYEEVLQSGYKGRVSMRVKGGPKNVYEYKVPIAEIPKIQREWISQGISLNLITFNESAPDHLLLIQGELMRSTDYYHFFYSTEKKPMREALKNGLVADGFFAKMLLEHYLNPSSYADLMALMDHFPDSVIEFSVYSRNLGCFPWRNTIIWEVRDY
jgi:hypothetical protein